MTKKPYVIGISGRIGAGKNYLATKLAETLHAQGFTSGETSYATPLKGELTSILELFRKKATNEEISQILNIPVNQVQHLSHLNRELVQANLDITGWTRSETIRQSLQYLGTDIRRVQDYYYWVNKVEDYFPENVDYVFITDVRFPNEADKIHDFAGTLIRVEVPDEVILSRTSTRDGLKYSKEALSHKSEQALNDYGNFDLIVGETYDVGEIIHQFK